MTLWKANSLAMQHHAAESCTRMQTHKALLTAQVSDMHIAGQQMLQARLDEESGYGLVPDNQQLMVEKEEQ